MSVLERFYVWWGSLATRAPVVVHWLWCLLQELVALLLLPFYGPMKFEFSDGILFVTVSRLIGYSGTVGQTWGMVVFLKPTATAWTRRHEIGHVAQGAALGPFFIVAYLAACVVAAARGGHYYADNFFELEADHFAETTAPRGE